MHFGGRVYHFECLVGEGRLAHLIGPAADAGVPGPDECVESLEQFLHQILLARRELGHRLARSHLLHQLPTAEQRAGNAVRKFDKVIEEGGRDSEEADHHWHLLPKEVTVELDANMGRPVRRKGPDDLPKKADVKYHKHVQNEICHQAHQQTQLEWRGDPNTAALKQWWPGLLR